MKVGREMYQSAVSDDVAMTGSGQYFGFLDFGNHVCLQRGHLGNYKVVKLGKP